MIISTLDDNKIPYHNKVISSYNNLINSIDERLIESNPIVSGSYAIKYIYAPKTTPNDLDLYFETEKDFDLALSILSHKHKNVYETVNAISFNDIAVQLIKKDFLSPEILITQHDLINVACAITRDKIYTTQGTHYAWYNEEICLQNYQVPPNPTKEQRLVVISNLVNRVEKYQDRYELSLSNSLKKFFYEQKEFLQNNPELSYTHTLTEIVLDYYGRPITDNCCYASAILTRINTILNSYDDSNGWEVDQCTWI
jgi:hypothetical protein